MTDHIVASGAGISPGSECTVGSIIALIPLTRLGPNNITFAFSKKKTNIFYYYPGGVDAEVEIADAEKLMYWELPSVMSSTTLTLMLTDMQRVTWRAAEGEDTLLLICSPTHTLPTVCKSTSTAKKGSVT